MSVLVLPRPDAHPPTTPRTAIPAPPESSFTATFGVLLPPTLYLTTPHGRAAYYLLPPSSNPAPFSSSSPTDPQNILLIHGIQTPALGLLPLARALRTAYPSTPIALLDLWGHGLSDTPQAAHTQDLFHGLIDSVLDALRWEEPGSVDVLGYSFGGMLTAGYVARSSNTNENGRVRRYVLIAPAGLLRISTLPGTARALLKGDPDEDADNVAEWVYSTLSSSGPSTLMDPAWAMRIDAGEIVPSALRAWQCASHAGHVPSVVSMFRDGGVWDNDLVFDGALQSGIRGFIVLGGEDDTCDAEEARGLGFEVAVIESVGHEVVREKVEEVVKLIKRFLAEE